MAQRASGYARKPDEEYETPAWVTRAIVPFLKKHCLHIWEPANGSRCLMARELRQAGFRVYVTDGDFLTKARLPDPRCSAVVTNPPYGRCGRLACRFIEHAIELVPVVCLLLRTDFDSGITRISLFRDCKSFSTKIVLLNRIKWFPGESGPSDNHAWFLWRRNHRGPPIIRYAQRDDDNGE